MKFIKSLMCILLIVNVDLQRQVERMFQIEFNETKMNSSVEMSLEDQ